MDRRTSFITAAAVAAVILAGGTAVAANVGILNSANNDSIGELTATDVTTTLDTSTITTVGAAPGSTTTSTLGTTPEALGQQFQVEDAAVVTVERTDAGIQLGEVIGQAGWSWTDAQASPSELTVILTSGDTTYVFTAQLAADGTISARVDQPIVQEVPATPAATVPSGSTQSGTTASGTTPSVRHSDGDDDHGGEREGGEDDD